MAIEILVAGLATTVQDKGRFGHYNVGIPQGGSLDQYSAELANALVGNSSDLAVLECTYMGPALRTDQDVDVAVAGETTVLVNGEPRPCWTRLPLRAGDELRFGLIKAGARFYVAFAGGVDVPLVLGSRSTYAIGGLGGVEGRALAVGDVVAIAEPTGAPPERDEVEARFRPSFEREQQVRVLFGLYDHLLTDEGRARLTDADWTLTPVADRAGMRYDGPGVQWRERTQPFGAGSDPSNIVDAGYAVGSIQIPGGTQPIILHRDAVSGGGYAMVATVISADMDQLARATPGTKTRFVPVTMDEALAARKARSTHLGEALASLR